MQAFRKVSRRKGVNGDKAYTRAVGKLPEYISISPITIVCPKCKAPSGDVCEVLLGGGLETVHVERIKAAAAMDLVVKERFSHSRKLSK